MRKCDSSTHSLRISADAESSLNVDPGTMPGTVEHCP